MTTVISAVGARNRKSLPSTKSRLRQTASWSNSRPQVETFKIIPAMPPSQGIPRPVCLLSEVFQISGTWLSEQAQIYSVLRRFNEIIIRKMIAKSSCWGLVYTFFLCWDGWYGRIQSRYRLSFFSASLCPVSGMVPECRPFNRLARTYFTPNDHRGGYVAEEAEAEVWLIPNPRPTFPINWQEE